MALLPIKLLTTLVVFTVNTVIPIIINNLEYFYFYLSTAFDINLTYACTVIGILSTIYPVMSLLIKIRLPNAGAPHVKL